MLNNNNKKNNDQIKIPLNLIDSKSKKTKINKDYNNNKSKYQKEKEENKEKEISTKEKENLIPTNPKESNKTKRNNFISKIPICDTDVYIRLGNNSKRNFISKL